MSEADDLQQYVRTGSQEAFARLVGAHVDMVYSVARRRVGDPGLADDVTQAVFLLLSRKAGSVGGMRMLPSWLFKATRFVCNNARRQAERRRRHEEKAAMMKSERQQEESEQRLEEMTPVLDEAVASLSAGDRDAILLRYYQKKSLRDVGEAMGMSEEAARKRVSRAVGRLREHFRAAGVAAPVAAIDGLLLSHAVGPAPAGVTASAATVGGKGAGVVALTKGAGVAMASTGVKVGVGVVAAVLAVGAGTGAYVANRADRSPAASATRLVAAVTEEAMARNASVTINGVTVALMGISTEADPRQWWGIDGRPVGAPIPPQPWRVRAPKSQVYRFGILIENAGDAGMIFRTEPPMAGASYFRRVAGSQTSQLREAQTAIDVGGARTMTLSVGVAIGEWQTVARAGRVDGPVATTRPGDPPVSIRRIGRTAFEHTVAVTHRLEPGVSARLVAVIDGQDVVGTTRVLRVNGETGVTEVTFETPRELGELRFETRPYTWFEFKNVATGPLAEAAG